jgi:Xaa-Pro aminopeptidase
MTYERPDPPRLEPRLRAILDQPWPRFSEMEMARRHVAIETAMAEHDVEYLLIYGAGGRGSAVPWLTDWSVTTEVICVATPGERDALFIQYFNHTPFAERLVDRADVHWGGASTIQTAIEELRRRGGDGARIGVIGPLPFGPYEALKDVASAVVSLNGAYTRMRLVKSEEELDWFRIGAALSDLAVDALLRDMTAGLTEHDLADIIERSFVPWGGRAGIHFIGTTPMNSPGLYVPAQFTSPREIAHGDIVFAEITVSFFDYGGQVLRSFALGGPPTPLYRALHDAADAAYDAIVAAAKPGATAQDLIDAGKIIEQAGFTHCDDLIHGYGGGYLPPVLGLPSRRDEPTPDFALEANMMMVVQPNVIAKDRTAGVQTGDCIVVTPEGGKSLHNAPRGFLMADHEDLYEGADDGG